MFYRSLFCLVTLLTASVSWAKLPSTDRPKQPNVLFILVDDLGKYDIAIEGSSF
ncbi:hypothetical protein [Aporhodopirellula aestuarii]|uniref:Sulfatase N-terminal domain-containing protein n=1 Tax=Aporhodopirellula aestuarii TaxID=2950107 RepID=A0ABT0UBJ2_9BACT|nr:hypothetical protein [Aporhodopirellula aestuarii]MCM2374192.1 hypothetical protein [Aporhodopirellula aestuarii]